MEKVLSLMKRMGEDIPIPIVWEALIKDYPIVINEGLIKTYDTKPVFNAICDSFRLRKNGVEPKASLLKVKGLEDIYIGDAYIKKVSNEEENILIILDCNEKFISNIEQRMNKYGWCLYRSDKGYDNRTEFLFEKKFPFCFKTKHLLRFIDKLYHITSKHVQDKILKQGLIPKKSKSPGFENEPRIYLWANEYSAIDEYKENDSSILNAKGVVDKIFLEIDLNKLNPEHKFYSDGRMTDGVFTNEPISPFAINVIEKFD